MTKLSSSIKRHFFAASTALLMGSALSGTAIAALTNPADLEIEDKLSGLTGGDATIDTPIPFGKRAPTDAELAQAMRAAIADPAGFGANPAQPANLIAQRATIFRRGTAPVLAEQAIIEIYNGGADGAVNTSKAFKKARKLAASTINAVMLEAQIGSKTDRAGAVSAIASQVVCGVNNNETILGSRYVKALKHSVSTMVKAVAGLQGNTAVKVNVPTGGKIGDRMDDDDGTTGDGKAQAYEAAGAVTGAVAQFQQVNSFAGNSLVNAVVSAAAKAAPKRSLEIAQAAATAAAFVYGSSANFLAGGGDKLILKAMQKGLGPDRWAQQKARVKQAVLFGIDQAGLALNGDTGALGAGAAGINNYAFNNCTGIPVTDISGF